MSKEIRLSKPNEKGLVSIEETLHQRRSVRDYKKSSLCLMEVGHVGQNISLQAVALNMGTVMIGAFDDRQVKEILGIEEEPLYIIPVGNI